MKIFLLIFILFPYAIFGADVVLDHSLNVKTLKTDDGDINATGSIQDTIANYPSKKEVIENAVSEKIWSIVDKQPKKAKEFLEIAETQSVLLSKELKDEVEKMQIK